MAAEAKREAFARKLDGLLEASDLELESYEFGRTSTYGEWEILVRLPSGSYATAPVRIDAACDPTALETPSLVARGVLEFLTEKGIIA